MIMPIDIDKKEFSRDKRGYNSREVDEFLDLIVVDYEKVLNDNRSMAHKIKALEKQLEEAQKSDTAMVETLQTAKKLMADISASAERRAELMMRDAELEAENILMDAKVSVKKLNDEHALLSTKVNRLRKNLRRMLESELAELDNDEYDLLVDVQTEEDEVVAKEVIEEPQVAPSKTIVFNEAPQMEVEDSDALLNEIFEGTKEEPKEVQNNESIFAPVTDLEHATISDLSESLKKMAEQPASLNDTIILK